MEYRVVVEDSPDNLAEEVNKLLSSGWKLQGGVCWIPPFSDGEQKVQPDLLQALTYEVPTVKIDFSLINDLEVNEG